VKIGIIGIFLSGVMGVAAAGEWSDYRKAFPLFPCSDGWSMCEVDGQTIGPGLSTDSQGNPVPANMRFSFWTLESMPSTSPFASLSQYSGQMGGDRRMKAEKETAVAEVAPAPPVRTRPPAARPQAPTTNEYIRDEYVPPVEPVAIAPVNLDPVVPVPVAPPASRGGYQPPSLAEMEAARNTGAPPAPVLPPPPPPPPPIIERESDPVAVVAPPAPPAVAAVVSCDDLVTMESSAIMGQLGVERRKCLDSRLAGGSKITGKDKISRVLIADAKARGDEADWERLMKRHLEKFDRSDPNMCLVFAIHLHKKGVGKATQVIRWSDYAMENKSVWSGSTHTRNVYYLHKLKSQGASRLWKRAEKQFVKDRNEKNESKANQYRSMAKQFSRAWLDYAKASGKDTSQPMAACVSASGNTEFCPS
jgi:hypothetical protein